MFTISKFIDPNILLDDNITQDEKRSWCACSLGWPLNKDHMDHYMNEEGIRIYNFLFDGEIVGHFCIWDKESNEPGYVLISRMYILKKYRNRTYEEKPFCHYLLVEALKESKSIFPNKANQAIIYDFSMNKINPQKAKGLECAKSVGFKEFSRISRYSNKFHIVDRVILIYDN